MEKMKKRQSKKIIRKGGLINKKLSAKFIKAAFSNVPAEENPWSKLYKE